MATRPTTTTTTPEPQHANPAHTQMVTVDRTTGWTGAVTTVQPYGTVHQAIAKVMADLPAISKADRSPEGYQYRGIEAITKHLQPLLARHGVVIVPQATVLQVVPSPAMKDGWQDVHMTVTWLVYGPDGSSLQATTHGIGRDRADKGSNKAHTQALKYLLLSLFMVADKDDDAERYDVTPDGDRAAAPKPQPRADLLAIADTLAALGIDDKAERLTVVSALAGREVAKASDLTVHEAAAVLDGLTAMLPGTEVVEAPQ
jgi:hypothetical protein